MTSNDASSPLRPRCGKLGTAGSIVSMLGALAILNPSTSTQSVNVTIMYSKSTVFSKCLHYVCLSAVFHVTYSFVSTSLVLSRVSVVSHAVANIMKRLLVVLLLYMGGQRTATLWNFSGLFVCSIGLLAFAWDKTKARGKPNSHFEGGFPLLCGKKYRAAVSTLAICFIAIITLMGHAHTEPRHTTAYNRLDDFKSSSDVVKDSKRSTEDDPEKGVNIISNISRDFKLKNAFERSSSLDSSCNFNKDPHRNSMECNNRSRVKNQNSSCDIIKRLQQVHFEILGKELKKFKYAFLIDIPTYENKGDSAITVGTIYFLSLMNIEIKFYCGSSHCTKTRLKNARDLSKSYSPDELVILGQGGGNLFIYQYFDFTRFDVLELFSSFQIFILPQGISLPKVLGAHFKLATQKYCCNPNLTIVVRDKTSFDYAKSAFNGSTRLLMVPDMAFQIGHHPRFMPPMFDIMWIKREDKETPGYSLPEDVPKDITVHASDWIKFQTPSSGSSLEFTYYATTMGFFFLQRGRVVITDRLHGHILSTLMDIPHVLIDNEAKKISNYHNTWTRSLHNTLITNDPSEALGLAIQLLKRFNDTIPTKAPYIRLQKQYQMTVETGYP